jgi:glutamate carboxypeptidase
MKGGLAVIWSALSALAEVGALQAQSLAVISVGDEEIGSADSRPIIEALAKHASCALVFEAGRLGDEVITRRKGTGSLAIDVTGRAAHAGANHRDGINAIRALARIVEAIEQLTDHDLGLTVNVGLISGGEARNTVPGSARAEVDLRFEAAADARALIAEIRQVADRVSSQSGARAEITGGVGRLPLERTAASAALYGRYATCAVAAGLGGGEAGLIGGGSDANTVSSAGVPAIDGLGPRGANFHTHDEYIEVATLALRTSALLRFLLA